MFEDTTRPVALVTGGSRGLGLATARRLRLDGHRVAILDLHSPDAGGDLGVHGDDYLYVEGDVTLTSAVESAVAAIEERLGSPEVLVNNAGILAPTRFSEIAEAEWDAVVDVTVKGAFHCAQACLPGMTARRRGRIINISSSAGRSYSTLGGVHYTAAKAAILGITRALAKEVGVYGVTVNAVCPGLFRTDMARAYATDGELNEFAKSFPIPRLGEPDEVAAAVSFLASNDAAYITGASLDVNGGDLML